MAKIKIKKNIKEYLSVLVRDNMQNNTMFTSLDITNQAKVAGHRIRNFQVADWLRRNAISIACEHSLQYNQELINVDSKAAGMTLAYLYLPFGTLSCMYLDRDQNPKSFQKIHKLMNKLKDNSKKSKQKSKKQTTDKGAWKEQKRDSKGRWV